MKNDQTILLTSFSLIIYLAILPSIESKEPTNCSQVINIKLSFFKYESK